MTAVSGSATSPPLTGTGGAALGAGSHEVKAEFVPDDAGATGSTETFTLVIVTDQAGNMRSARGNFRVLSYFVQHAPFRDHAFTVHVGRAHTLVAKSPKQPRYFLAAPAPTTPFERGPKLRPAGHDRWAPRISITRPMAVHDVWKVGVRTGGKPHVLRLHLHG